MRADWEFEDDTLLDRAWSSMELLVERTFISCVDPNGVRRYRPVTCHMRRAGDYIVVLWGRGVERPRFRPNAPLLTGRIKATGAPDPR